MDLKTEGDVVWIADVLETNLRHAKKTKAGKACFIEISELVNDTIEYLQKVPRDGDEFSKSAKAVFLATSLMPMSFGIYVDFLAGNVPVCFMQLRMMIESMALYYSADREYNEKNFFYDKLRSLEEVQRKASMAKFIAGVDKDAAKLWHKSSQWMHASSLAGKLVKHIAERGVPTWALIMPMEYTRADSNLLLELRNGLSEFRQILKHILEEWNY